MIDKNGQTLRQNNLSESLNQKIQNVLPLA